MRTGGACAALFRYPPLFEGGAEDSYGIEDGSSSSSKSSENKGQGPPAQETGAERCRQGCAEGGNGQSSTEHHRPGRKACPRRREGPRQQCRGDQGGRHQGRRQG